MWIFRNDCFVSVVRHREKDDCLLVRSRVEGDIERFFDGSRYQADVFQDPVADYRYRAVVEDGVVASCLAEAVKGIGYPNFKNSIPSSDPARHRAYTDVWRDMALEYGSYGSKAK